MTNQTTSYSKISAVILDLDGTLLNTEFVLRSVLKEYLATYGKVLVTDNEFARVGKTQKESAAAIVKNYDLPLTPQQYLDEINPLYHSTWKDAKALPGANRLIQHLHKHKIPCALASNSLRAYIESKISTHKGWRLHFEPTTVFKYSQIFGYAHVPSVYSRVLSSCWKEYFSIIIGSDQVQSGKPEPDLFLEAAKQLTVNTSNCLVIEDSLVGVKAGKAAGMKVVVVPSETEADAAAFADLSLNSLLEFQPELWGLPPFDDWVGNALPVDPIYLDGQLVDGFVAEFREKDGQINVLPHQVYGIYFGWAKIGINKETKVVVRIQREVSSSLQSNILGTNVQGKFSLKTQGIRHCGVTDIISSHNKPTFSLSAYYSYVSNLVSSGMSKILISLLQRLCSIDESTDHLHGEQIHLVIVGYIRGFNFMGTLSSNSEICEDDKSVALSALSLPMFKCPESS